MTRSLCMKLTQSSLISLTILHHTSSHYVPALHIIHSDNIKVDVADIDDEGYISLALKNYGAAVNLHPSVPVAHLIVEQVRGVPLVEVGEDENLFE